MDYKEKYENGVECIQEILSGAGDLIRTTRLRKRLEPFFPELKEDENDSKDERIKESIKKVLANTNFNKLDIKYSFSEMIDWLEKQVQKEVTWNKEDEENMNNVLYILHQLKDTSSYEEDNIAEKTINWFKSLKDRLCSNNEYDKDMLGAIEYCKKNNRPLEKEHLVWLEKHIKEECALKSSSDEDVNKFMQYIEKQAKAYEFNLPNRGYDIYGFAKDILQWLEKQGEKKHIFDADDWYVSEVDGKIHNGKFIEKQGKEKPADKIEPKFHEDDWIVFNGLILHIDEVVNGYYRTTSKGDGIHNSYDWDIDNAARLWTIQEAKDGDVLCYEIKNDFKIFIYKQGHIHYHCCYSNEHLTPVESFFTLQKHQICYIHPATKEQRDLLFQKMKEEGYKWDAEKKEVKRIAPKILDADDILPYLGNNQVQDILEDMGMLDDNGQCPHTAEEIFKAGMEHAFNLNREAASSVKIK